MCAEDTTKAQRRVARCGAGLTWGLTTTSWARSASPRPYSITLATDNLALISPVCAFSCLLVLACIAVHVVLLQFSHAIVSPSLPAILMFAGIAALAGRSYEPAKRPKTALFLTLALCITWYAFAMYCDIVLQPYQRSVLTCLALVTLPLLFDARPRDNVLGSLIALSALLVLEHLFVDPATRTMDVLGAYIAVVVGLMVAQRKTASRLNEIIYLDMYRTATKTSILVVQADLRTDAFHALQVPDYMQPVVSKYTSATETLRRVGETFVQSDYLDEYMKFFNMTSLAQRLQKSDQVNCTFQDFRSLWCQVTVVAQSRRAGKMETVVIIVRDIDAEKHQELEYQRQLHNAAVEAQRANASKTNFLRRMSDDIRTPINGIRAWWKLRTTSPTTWKNRPLAARRCARQAGFCCRW